VLSLAGLMPVRAWATAYALAWDQERNAYHADLTFSAARPNPPDLGASGIARSGAWWIQQPAGTSAEPYERTGYGVWSFTLGEHGRIEEVTVRVTVRQRRVVNAENRVYVSADPAVQETARGRDRLYFLGGDVDDWIRRSTAADVPAGEGSVALTATKTWREPGAERICVLWFSRNLNRTHPNATAIERIEVTANPVPFLRQFPERGPWTASTRKRHRPEATWRTYMHGVVDHFAEPIPLAALFSAEFPARLESPPGTRWRGWAERAREHIRTLFTEAYTDVLRLGGEFSLELDRPLPIADMDAVRDRRVRIFLWMHGRDAGARNNVFHAPGFGVVMRNAEGAVLATASANVRIQRTFPWHAYYTDVFVPAATAGIHLRVYNKFHGTASFALPSWELITAENTYSNDEKQDPFTGSLAYNPVYAPMVYHLTPGYGYRYPWRFVLGRAIGLVGQLYDVTTCAGLRRYYFECARHDPDQMNHGILHIGGMYRAGTAQGLLPPREEGWLETLRDILVAEQDAETGFWHDSRSLSLGLTFHLVDMHFRYRGIPRADRETQLFPDKCLGLRQIPRAANIIRSVLASQSSWVDENGARRRAAWNRTAYGFTTTPDASPEKADLCTTWDAINLVRRASNYVTPERRREVEAAVREAFYYVLRFNVDDHGLFRQSDRDDHPTGGGYMGAIMQDSAWLERKIDPSMPAPEVQVSRPDGRAVFTWLRPAGNQNSVRIYAVPPATPREEIDESFLVGIIQRTGHQIHEMDPLPGCRKIREAMHRRWGTSLELPPPEHWRGRRYLPWKLRRISFPIPSTVDCEPLTLPAAAWAGKDLYVSAVTWYGEEAPAVRLDGGQP